MIILGSCDEKYGNFQKGDQCLTCWFFFGWKEREGLIFDSYFESCSVLLHSCVCINKHFCGRLTCRMFWLNMSYFHNTFSCPTAAVRFPTQAPPDFFYLNCIFFSHSLLIPFTNFQYVAWPNKNDGCHFSLWSACNYVSECRVLLKYNWCMWNHHSFVSSPGFAADSSEAGGCRRHHKPRGFLHLPNRLGQQWSCGVRRLAGQHSPTPSRVAPRPYRLHARDTPQQ